MLATKNRCGNVAALFLTLALLVAGCTPPGARALLDGKKLLDKGQNEEAVEKLKTATSLLATNAQAWNYLGLAYHRTGQPTNAATAYQNALVLNRNLVEAHYNLGCLWLDEDKLDAAKTEFTAYVLSRNNAPEGWLKLGTVQARSGDGASAEKSFQQALRLQPKNPEALNGLGLIQIQRHRPRDAAQQFAAALKQQPDYRPALLNLATVSQQYLNDPTGALQRYREYLALTPRASDWEAVNAVADTLEQQLTVTQRPPAPTVVTQVVATVTPPKTNQAKAQPAPIARPITNIESAPAPRPNPPVEVVTIAPEPTIRTASDVAVERSPTPQPPPATQSPNVVVDAPKTINQPAKRGFFSKLNPFKREPKPETHPTPLPASDSTKTAQQNPPPSKDVVITPPPDTSSFPRYRYVSPKKPANGNRSTAESAFAAGLKSQQTQQMPEALQSYQQAAKLDPAYFEAHYSVGLAAYQLQDYRHALSAWENALALQPDSTDARYNFALTLKSANYPVDAALELEKILRTNPSEARAHLMLGNLYAEPLQDTTRARVHYLKVLELEPRHPQAGVIRYWLTANPE